MPGYYDQKPWLKTYPNWLPQTFELPETSVLDLFTTSVDAYPEDPCVCYFAAVYSYKKIHRMARNLAAALSEMGVGQGHRVLLVMQNIPQTIVTSLAVWMCNGVVVPINPMYTARDVTHLLDDSGARLIVCQDDLYESTVKNAIEDIDPLSVITTSPLDMLNPDEIIPKQLKNAVRLSFPDTIDFIELASNDTDDELEFPKPTADDLAYLVYTSGTTGPPKGAMLTHGNIVYNSETYEIGARLDRSDVVLGVAPLFHITGIVAHLAIAFRLGIPVVIFNRFDVADVLRLIETYHATFVVASITVYIAILNHPDSKKYSIASLTKAYSGGAPVSPSTVRKFEEVLGLTIYNVYGLTESASPATMTPLGLSGPVDQESGALSVGLIIPGHEAWIVDVENPELELPPGQAGELVLRGPCMVSGYWRKPAETANAIKDGRFHTGDVAKIDEQGWCYIVDRKKDLINVSGFKVWPRDVEDALYQHPAVIEAAVVGVPDDYRGETVKAFVALSADYKNKVSPEELISFCKSKLAAFKYPRIVEIIDEVPKTPTGKFLRRELRER
ncbi:Long-chain-fatty-acid--CoA ligase (EC [Olavius sp. associated proteobacterium Delta 1]|nr:Long-chain-fatty-acid--CoA ligase (EC [Olavius sp. associated proteobacterium Delta 1]